MFGIIGGSGIYRISEGEPMHVETPYGWVKVCFGKMGGKQVAFMPRHGEEHIVPPHAINHRANIYAMKEVGVNKLVGVNACGIISKFKPGEIITVEDFIAFHMGPVTFYDTFKHGVMHTDMSEPYSKQLNSELIKAGRKARVKIKRGGIIASSYGPRFETPAEIRAFGKMGANLINMTSAPEAILARELDMDYASIAIGTNYAAGLTKKHLSHEEVVGAMRRNEKKVFKVLGALPGSIK